MKKHCSGGAQWSVDSCSCFFYKLWWYVEVRSSFFDVFLVLPAGHDLLEGAYWWRFELNRSDVSVSFVGIACELLDLFILACRERLRRTFY